MATGIVIRFNADRKIAFVKDDHSGDHILIRAIDPIVLGNKVYYILLKAQTGLIGIKVKIIN